MRAGIPAQSYGGAHHVRATWFGTFANKTAQVTGKPATFLLATLVVVVWAATGPIFRYSDTWQLVINTGTTIVTFLMVFLIQHSQIRDTLAIQIKLSELVLAAQGAENKLARVNAEFDKAWCVDLARFQPCIVMTDPKDFTASVGAGRQGASPGAGLCRHLRKGWQSVREPEGQCHVGLLRSRQI